MKPRRKHKKPSPARGKSITRRASPPGPQAERTTPTAGISALHRSIEARSSSSTRPHALRAFAASLVQLESDYRRVNPDASLSTKAPPVRPIKARSAATGAAQSTTSRRTQRALIQLAELVSTDVVYIAGCGDGSIAFLAARKPRVRVVGIEPDVRKVELARKRATRARIEKRVRFTSAALFDLDLGRATVVIVVREPLSDAALSRQLLDQLRPGTRIVSHTADLGEWTTRESSRIEGRRVRCWVVPTRGGASRPRIR